MRHHRRPWSSRRSALAGAAWVSVAAFLAIGSVIFAQRAEGADAARRSVKDMKLKVSPNGRYLVDQQGRPFFYLGDTCWLLFQRPNREELMSSYFRGDPQLQQDEN